MPIVQGRITAVQESRFRLLTDDGRTLLLTLARRAPLSEQDLCRLQAADSLVQVVFSGQPNLTSGVAHSVTCARSP